MPQTGHLVIASKRSKAASFSSQRPLGGMCSVDEGDDDDDDDDLHVDPIHVFTVSAASRVPRANPKHILHPKNGCTKITRNQWTSQC